MSRKNFQICLLASACWLGVLSLDYSDLEAIGIACPSRDSCAGYRNTANFSDRNCECDNTCFRYGDCCIDANIPPSRRNNRNLLRNRMCLPFGGHFNTGVYVVNTCQPNWSGPAQLRQKCQGEEDLSDPLNAAPVISRSQGVAYRNRYCAECNSASPSTLTSFQILVNCDGVSQFNDTDYVWNNIEFNSTTRKWGMNRWNPSLNRAEFLLCDVLFDLPAYSANAVRKCRANLISSCPRTWMRHQVRRECESYMAVVFGDGRTVYKNPHCALCHDLTIDDFACDQGILGRAKKPLSFALLLDVNQSDGDQVGVSRQATPSCPSGQKYDPFFKKCRLLVCALPGYVMAADGKCQRT